ncbi:histone acetyltransferase HAC12, partial [Tanacetum coccineum]
LSFNDNETESGPGHIKIQSVSSVDCEMVSESESTEAQTACFDDNKAQTACFDDISSGSGSGNMKIPSVSSVNCGMVSESEKTKKTKIQVACYGDKSSGSRSGNMKIPSVSLADFITASQIKQHLSSFNPDNRWVECDRCKKWQHYICGLYNKERDQGEGEYICSKCRLTEIEEGKWAPQTVLAAKDLPRTNLSDHIEQRLVTRIKQEREETAKSKGTELKNVAEVEGLVVRVMLSVDKELEVKKQFRDIFEGKDYPEKLKYRSKRLGGVDVCVFGMYVQEYGSECSGPNNRCVYIHTSIPSSTFNQKEKPQVASLFVPLLDTLNIARNKVFRLVIYGRVLL